MRLEQEGRERFVGGAVGPEMAAVECDRFDTRHAELAIARRVQRRTSPARNAPVSYPSNRQMPAPSAFLALESALSRDRLEPGRESRKRARLHNAQTHPNRARMLEVGKRADARRGQLERRRPGRELT